MNDLPQRLGPGTAWERKQICDETHQVHENMIKFQLQYFPGRNPSFLLQLFLIKHFFQKHSAAFQPQSTFFASRDCHIEFTGDTLKMPISDDLMGTWTFFFSIFFGAWEGEGKGLVLLCFCWLLALFLKDLANGFRFSKGSCERSKRVSCFCRMEEWRTPVGF